LGVAPRDPQPQSARRRRGQGGARSFPHKTIIAYCTCPDEEASARLTRVLRDEGYDAWMLDGGLPAWRAAGYPMEVNQAA
jgi:rhodanese-related sulfurtransferase